MSWSATFKVDASNEEAVELVTSSGLDTDEHKLQHDQGLIAAMQLLMSGVVGSHERVYTVTLSGHGNPGNEPAPGWSNDFVNIQVVQQ
jgi:hypothetical protein